VPWFRVRFHFIQENNQTCIPNPDLASLKKNINKPEKNKEDSSNRAETVIDCKMDSIRKRIKKEGIKSKTYEIM